MVGIKSPLCRENECNRKSRLAIREEIFKALIRFTWRSEARILAHRPEFAPIHVPLNTASVRIFARQSGRLMQIVRTVKAVKFGSRIGRKTAFGIVGHENSG